MVGAALIPLLWEPRFYFLGDTQVGAFGQWLHLGSKLWDGEWPLIDLPAWHGGNYVSEGQWGLFSPLTMGIGLAAAKVTQVVLFVTVIKFALLTAAAVGVFLLTRSYGVPHYAAYVAGVAVTLGGATQYLDSPEWVTGQMVWALIPFAWWATRRTMNVNANPATALVFGLLTVTVGYVYGTIYLAVVFVACLVDAWVARNLAGAVRVLLIGVCCGLVAVAVYLPGILSASVTTRAGLEVLSEGRLQADVPGLLASMIPTVLSPSSPVPPAPAFPAHYIAWFLPMLAWLDLRQARRLVRPALGLIVVVVLGVLWALGPNQVGPLRWPIRVMPFLTLSVMVLFAVLWSKAVLRRPPLRRLVFSLILPVGATYLIISRFWEHRWMTFASLVVVVVGLIAVWALARWGGGGSPNGHVSRPRVVAVFLAAWSLGVVGLQHHYYPSPTAVDRNMPATIAGYSTQAASALGDVMMVGNPEPAVLRNTGAVRDFLIASSWYVNPHPVQNVYSTIGFTAYNERYGLRFDGATYPDLLTTLFESEPRTGRQRADLLSISSLHIVRREQSETTVMNPPAGWRVGGQTPWAVTWVRNQPVPSAGGVVWSSPGLDVTQLSSTTREVRLRVNQAPTDGGVVVLSRLAWPGYSVQGGALAPPTDGYLTTVDLPAASAGQTVTVRYAPPGWAVELAALWIGCGVGLLWSVGMAVARGRRVRNQRVRVGPAAG